MKIKNVLLVYYVHNYKTLELVEKCLKTSKISYVAKRRVHLTNQLCKNKDLVIVVGGDGTFLRAAHHTDDTPIFAVSSDVMYNEAFYAQAAPKDFVKKFKLLLAGKFRIKKLPRLEGKINGKKMPLAAINEIFVGSSHPYHTSRYELKVRGRKEFQKSSGVLITTHTGSTGWAKSAAKGKLKIAKKGFGYVVREPYIGRLTKSKLLKGSLRAKDKVIVNSQMYAGIVVVDSSEKVHKLVDGDKLEVGISKKALNYVVF